MKAPVLALIVAAAAFGGTSIYFWNEMQSEHARAEEYAAKSAALTARIAELEKARTQFQQRRFASANSFGDSPMGAGSDHPPPGDPESKPDTREEPRWGRPPERSEAMQKVMRTQVRATNKRLYADFGSQAGLSKDQTNKLIDLLTDHQVQGFGNRGAKDPEEARSLWEESQRQLDSDIGDVIGADKVASFEEYQKTLPARHELEMVSRQLDGYDAPLNDDQSKRLLAAMVEERGRVAAPQFVEGMDPAVYQKARAAWQDDYSARVNSQASSILSADQATAYTEIQQAQKEMQAQFGGMPGGPRGGMRSAPGGGVMITNAMPVLISGDTAIVAAPPPKK